MKNVKLIVSFLVAGVLLCSPAPSVLYYAIGSVLNGLLSILIKRALQCPRPVGSRKMGYGMPSSHAQSLFYFTTLLIINPLKFANILPITAVFSMYTILSWYTFSFNRIADVRFSTICTCSRKLTLSYPQLFVHLFSKWRVDDRLHSLGQTVAGAILGTMCAAIAVYCELSFTQLIINKKLQIFLDGHGFGHDTDKGVHMYVIEVPFLWRVLIASVGMVYINRNLCLQLLYMCTPYVPK